jgi:hypothetical protein
MILKQCCRLLFCAFFGLLLANTAFAAKLGLRETDSSSRFVIDLGFVSLKNDEAAAIKGFSAGLGVSAGLTSELGIQAMLEQAFDAGSGFGSVYSLIEIGGVFCPYGSLKNKKTEVTLNGDTVVSTESASPQTVRLAVFANQYFLNGSTKVIGLAGIGFGGYFDQVITPRLSATFGAKWSIASNGTTTIQPLKFTAGISFAL